MVFLCICATTLTRESIQIRYKGIVIGYSKAWLFEFSIFGWLTTTRDI